MSPSLSHLLLVLLLLSVVRLLTTFEEQGHFCLVLELLGPPVLEVGRWGPWRHALSGARAAPNQTLRWKVARDCERMDCDRGSVGSRAGYSGSDGGGRGTEHAGRAFCYEGSLNVRE